MPVKLGLGLICVLCFYVGICKKYCISNSNSNLLFSATKNFTLFVLYYFLSKDECFVYFM